MSDHKKNSQISFICNKASITKLNFSYGALVLEETVKRRSTTHVENKYILMQFKNYLQNSEVSSKLLNY